jgi:hypothetical protein
MLRLVSDENFNGDIVRGLLPRLLSPSGAQKDPPGSSRQR